MPLVPPSIPGISGWVPLARGGFATVWKARQDSLNRLVAVKVDDRRLDNETERRRFLSEARAAGGLSGHPGIVTVHDAGILEDSRPYLVMELCPGGSLTSWLRPEHRQSEDRIRLLGVRIADALAAAHAQGMLHRDVKPANILVDEYGNAGLADFGLATLRDAGNATGTAPVRPGNDVPSATYMTPAYAPLEAIRHQPPSEAGDVYQLAATMYALLSGDTPHWPSESHPSLPQMIELHAQPVPVLKGVDARLMAVILQALSSEPDDRPTAAQLRDQLAGIDLSPPVSVAAAEQVVDAEPPPVDGGPTGSSAITGRTRKRRPVLTVVLALIIGVLVLILGTSAFYLYKIDRSVTANLNRGIALPPDGSGSAPRPAKDPAAADALDYVLIGSDEGDPDLDRDGRSDSIMLVHLTAARDRAYIISVPRTTWVQVPGHGSNTINAAMSEGGPTLVVQTVEKLTGARVDHIAMIDFEGFVELTDDLGGVTVSNQNAFVSHGFSYPRGKITMEGERALWFVREDDAISDAARAENQRNVLKAILSKGLSPDVVADPVRFTRFLSNAAKRIQVDDGLTDGDIRSTVFSLRLRPSNIELLQVPLGATRTVDGQRVSTVDTDRLADLSDALRRDTMADYLKKYPRG